MKTIDYIKMSLETSKMLTLGLLDDMKDAPLTQPTVNGGNHPLWILGHWTYSEANIINHIILGDENPLIEWKEIFGGGGDDPVTDASHYPSWDELRQKFDEIRAQTMRVVDSFNDEDLDKPSKNCPPDREAFFGTIGKCLLVAALHPVMHRGQVADSRRALGRPVLVA